VHGSASGPFNIKPDPSARSLTHRLNRLDVEMKGVKKEEEVEEEVVVVRDPAIQGKMDAMRLEGAFKAMSDVQLEVAAKESLEAEAVQAKVDVIKGNDAYKALTGEQLEAIAKLEIQAEAKAEAERKAAEAKAEQERMAAEQEAARKRAPKGPLKRKREEEGIDARIERLEKEEKGLEEDLRKHRDETVPKYEGRLKEVNAAWERQIREVDNDAMVRIRALIEEGRLSYDQARRQVNDENKTVKSNLASEKKKVVSEAKEDLKEVEESLRRKQARLAACSRELEVARVEQTEEDEQREAVQKERDLGFERAYYARKEAWDRGQEDTGDKIRRTTVDGRAVADRRFRQRVYGDAEDIVNDGIAYNFWQHAYRAGARASGREASDEEVSSAWQKAVRDGEFAEHHTSLFTEAEMRGYPILPEWLRKKQEERGFFNGDTAADPEVMGDVNP